jgi:dTDP-4-dehydrorhamnose 3,5-epimerase
MNPILTFKDERGVFIPYSCNNNGTTWDQINISINPKKFTFRGMHYQTNPPQLKQVKVIQGRVIDFLYDLKTHEVKTYELDLNNDLVIDPKYAHGFLTLEDNTIFTYKVSTEYNPNSEHSIIWDTIPEIKKIINGIVGDNKLIISKKDKIGK